nr:hypothetical protein [Streptomyces sp. F63]
MALLDEPFGFEDVQRLRRVGPLTLCCEASSASAGSRVPGGHSSETIRLRRASAMFW